jgi:CBS domain-containing protein
LKEDIVKTCGDVMTPDPVCCLATDTVDKAAKIMKMEDVGSVPVTDREETKRLIGIVTDRDLAIHIVAEGLDPRNTRVEQVMTREPIRCKVDENLEEALDAMKDYQIRRIPVVDESGRILGIIAQADVATRVKDSEEVAEVVEEISESSGS